jgi:hypothetical protein
MKLRIPPEFLGRKFHPARNAFCCDILFDAEVLRILSLRSIGRKSFADPFRIPPHVVEVKQNSCGLGKNRVIDRAFPQTSPLTFRSPDRIHGTVDSILDAFAQLLFGPFPSLQEYLTLGCCRLPPIWEISNCRELIFRLYSFGNPISSP